MIFLLRHGQIQDSERKRYIGTTDVCLDNTGVLQAHYWKTVFSSINIDTIYSSSLKRCNHTAQ
ncbi:MAG: histidine phosphatase family protein, partial [Desulfobacteraceae bacterium]|nr:histidine phosphatase family protein [Desulfobacteraceae bacterium]